MKNTIVAEGIRFVKGIYSLIIAHVLVIFVLASCGKNSTPDEQLELRLKALEAAAPGVGTIMSSVQLHFAKLYFAGKAKNSDLVEFELHEVEENLDKAVTLRPEEQGTNLVGLNDGFKQTQLAGLKGAAERKDWNAFETAYSEALGVCNGCHEETGRPFIVITIPATPPVSNQQWEAPIRTSEKR